MSRIVRAALTETTNAFADMPQSVEQLPRLAQRLDDIRATNVAHHVQLIGQAAASGARLVGLGELFIGPYFALSKDPMWRALAEDATEGPTVTALRPVAREHTVVIVAPIYELDSATGKRFNTAVVIDSSGEVLGKYRKTHIPAGKNETAAFHEPFYYEASDGELGPAPANVSDNPYFPVFRTTLGRIGVAICYDRHFEGSVRSLARGGAEIVLCPAVTFGTKSRRMWDLEFAVDAARHGVFIGGSNREGAESPWDVEFFGASYFAGPNGRVPALPAPPGLVLADLDLGERERGDPAGWNLTDHARPDIYSR